MKRRIGFWIPIQHIGTVWGQGVTPRVFADAYFHSKPYPAVVYVSFDSMNPAVWNGFYWTQWVRDLAVIGDVEGFQICVAFAIYNPPGLPRTVFDEALWIQMGQALDLLAGHQSIAYVGIQGEYMSHGFPAGTLTHDNIISVFSRYKGMVESRGMKFGCHYYPSPFAAYLSASEMAQFGPWAAHTNYPFEGEPASYLSKGTDPSTYVGMTAGIWNSAATASWNLQALQTVFNYWKNITTAVRQYGLLIGYLDSDGSFTYMDDGWKQLIYDVFNRGNYPDLITMEDHVPPTPIPPLIRIALEMTLGIFLLGLGA